MRIYLDVCCLNRPFDNQGQDRIHLEAEAVLVILNHSKMAGWKIVASDAIDFEIAQMPDQDKRLKVQILSGLHDEFVKVDAYIEKRAIELSQLGLQGLDALHVACAEKAKSSVFLTTDDQLLTKAHKNAITIKIKKENPLKWITEVL